MTEIGGNNTGELLKKGNFSFFFYTTRTE